MGAINWQVQSVLLLTVFSHFVQISGESSGYQVSWDDCSYETFKQELIRSCKYKRDGTPNAVVGGGLPRAAELEKQGIYPPQENDMDFYQEIHGPYPAGPQRPMMRQVPVPVRLVQPRRLLHPQNQPNARPYNQPPSSLLPIEAFQMHEVVDGGKTRKRMLRNSYMSLAKKCCGKICDSDEFRKYCP